MKRRYAYHILSWSCGTSGVALFSASRVIKHHKIRQADSCSILANKKQGSFLSGEPCLCQHFYHKQPTARITGTIRLYLISLNCFDLHVFPFKELFHGIFLFFKNIQCLKLFKLQQSRQITDLRMI